MYNEDKKTYCSTIGTRGQIKVLVKASDSDQASAIVDNWLRSGDKAKEWLANNVEYDYIGVRSELAQPTGNDRAVMLPGEAYRLMKRAYYHVVLVRFEDSTPVIAKQFKFTETEQDIAIAEFWRQVAIHKSEIYSVTFDYDDGGYAYLNDGSYIELGFVDENDYQDESEGED